MVSTTIQPGDVFHHRTAGGGGFGNPLERDPEAVLADVLEDKVGTAAARERYGVVIRGGRIDHAATAARRSRG